LGWQVHFSERFRAYVVPTLETPDQFGALLGGELSAAPRLHDPGNLGEVGQIEDDR
jgi:hypothetical protein